MKTFRREVEKIRYRLKAGRNFTLTRYGDGEWSIILGQAIDILGKANGEFRYTPGEPADEASRALLQDSFSHQAADYYVGIGCPCCMGDQHVLMRQRSGQPEDHLTFANVFVNANSDFFMQEVAPLLFERTSVMVGHEKGQVANLPFRNAPRYIGITPNAWLDSHTTANVLELAEANTDKVFLFAAGPLANILAYECNKANPGNTYIDIGSVFDPYLFRGTGVEATRGYHTPGYHTRSQVCSWSEDEPVDLASARPTLS